MLYFLLYFFVRDPDEILQKSHWNDELKVWKLPEASMDAFKLPLASSLQGKQFLDSTLQKRINSSNSLQNSLNNVSFIPVNFLKETIDRHIYSNNTQQQYMHTNKHFSARSRHIEKNKDENKIKNNNIENVSHKTSYAFQVKL